MAGVVPHPQGTNEQSEQEQVNLIHQSLQGQKSNNTRKTLHQAPLGTEIGSQDNLTVPGAVSSILEGGGGTTPRPSQRVPFKPPPVNKYSVWAHFVCLTLLMLSAVILSAFSFYLELDAFRRDVKWDEILKNKIPFPKAIVKGDVYFGGKKLKNVPAFQILLKNQTMLRNLTRDHNLEIVAMSCISAFQLIALVHLMSCLISKKVRNNLKIMYLSYGVGGWLLFTAAILVAVSTIGPINKGYLNTRKMLEDSEEKSTSVHQNSGKVKSNITKHCYVNSTWPDKEEREILLRIVKMCAYRYSIMNWRDPCKDLIRDRIQKLHLNGVSYFVKDLEDFYICGCDTRKLLASILLIVGTLTCWLAMWEGSYMEARVLEPKYWKKGTLWSFGLHSKSVIGIEGWSPRSNIPSYMEIELSMRPSNADFTLPNIPMEMAPPPLVYLSAAQSLASIVATTHKPGFYNPSVSFMMIGGGSVMTIAPKFVIHPPHQHQRKTFQDSISEENVHKKTKKPQNYDWFNM